MSQQTENDHAAPSAPTPLGAELAPSDIIATARSYARKWNLVCDNGQIVCLRDGCGLEATLPTLLCTEHLAAHRSRVR